MVSPSLMTPEPLSIHVPLRMLVIVDGKFSSSGLEGGAGGRAKESRHIFNDYLLEALSSKRQQEVF